jgi:hypothetical protein
MEETNIHKNDGTLNLKEKAGQNLNYISKNDPLSNLEGINLAKNPNQELDALTANSSFHKKGKM